MAKATYLRAPVKSPRESCESLTGPAPGTIPWEKLLTPVASTFTSPARRWTTWA
jgi:hypothetical protein